MTHGLFLSKNNHAHEGSRENCQIFLMLPIHRKTPAAKKNLQIISSRWIQMPTNVYFFVGIDENLLYIDSPWKYVFKIVVLHTEVLLIILIDVYWLKDK